MIRRKTTQMYFSDKSKNGTNVLLIFRRADLAKSRRLRRCPCCSCFNV